MQFCRVGPVSLHWFSTPITLPDGAPFPGRELIIFVTSAVIALTLVVQGRSLPLLIRALGLDREGKAECNDEAHLEYEARIMTLDAGLKRLEELVRTGKVPPAFAALYKRELRERKRKQTFERHGAASANRQRRNLAKSELKTMLEATEAQREELLRLHHEGKIDDEIVHRIERDLDETELRLQTRVETLPARASVNDQAMLSRCNHRQQSMQKLPKDHRINFLNDQSPVRPMRSTTSAI